MKNKQHRYNLVKKCDRMKKNRREQKMMQEQTIILNNTNSFNPVHIFECGQCFRWNKQKDNSYIGVVGNNVLKVQKEENKIKIQSIGEDDLESLVTNYFDLQRDYSKIKKELSKVDPYLAKSISYGNGIRILNQDLWETIISFIISANNNIPRIKVIIDRLSKTYGNSIEWNENIYYTFPTVQQLSKASIQELRGLGLGFRDIRVYETTQKIANGEVSLQELLDEADTNKVREKLLQLSGVGPKVADCILLFSTLKRFDVFPVDVWVRRVMNELYLHQADEKKVKRQQIEQLAKEKYGNLEGIAQQYLFYWKREA